MPVLADESSITSPVIELALKRYKLGVEARDKQLKREIEDLKMQVPELMWPDDAKAQRMPQVIGGVAIPARPMLSIPKLDQPVQLVLNQEKSAHLGVQVHPLSEDATDDTAEVIQGLYRRIEVDSRANLARSWAYDRAVKCGWGCYRVLKEYADDGGDPFDQKIVIKRVLNQGAAVFDPFAVEPDWCDGRWAFVPEVLPFDRYKQQFPKSALAKYDNTSLSGLAQELAEPGSEFPGWVTGDGEARAVMIAEYWRVEYGEKVWVLLADGTPADEAKLPPGTPLMTGPKAKRRTVDVPQVKFVKMNAIESLEEEEWDGQYIPLIPVIGRELQPFDNERRWVGMYRPAADGQRLFNYAASGLVEMAALESKAPYTMVEGQQEGHELEWQQANIRNFPYLLYRNVSLNGQPAPPPQRTQVDTSRMGPCMLLLQESNSFIQSSTFTFDPSLGKESTKDRSGKAVLAQQQQGDASNSHFLDNLAEISMTYEAKVVLDLIPKVYDRPGRVARILGIDDKASTVMLNQPYVQGPGGRPMAAPDAPAMPQRGPQGMPPQSQAGQPKVKHHDLRRGIYGVSVSIGKSYQTRMQHGADALGQVLQADPALMAILGDIWFRFQDFPGHTEASERLKKMLPPPLQEQPDGAEPDVQQITQQRDQAAQLVETLGKELDAKNELIKTEAVKQQAQVAIKDLEFKRDVELKRMADATALAIAQINAAVKGVIFEREAQNEALALHQELTHDSRTQAAQQLHEHQQAELERAHQVSMGAAGQAHDAGMAGMQHDQALEQGEQGHAQALEAQEQAAALAPAPESEA